MCCKQSAGILFQNKGLYEQMCLSGIYALGGHTILSSSVGRSTNGGFLGVVIGLLTGPFVHKYIKRRLDQGPDLSLDEKCKASTALVIGIISSSLFFFYFLSQLELEENNLSHIVAPVILMPLTAIVGTITSISVDCMFRYCR